MAISKKNQSASIRFGPALKAFFSCLLIAGSAVGYVWQKTQNYQLGKQIHQAELRVRQLARDNENLENRRAGLTSPVALDLRAHNLGLVPAQPMQIVPLPEPSLTPTGNKNSAHEFAARMH